MPHQHEDVDEHEHFDESIHETSILMKYYAHRFQDLGDMKARLMDLGMFIEYFLSTLTKLSIQLTHLLC